MLRDKLESDLLAAVSAIKLKLDFCTNFSSAKLAGHHDSAITLPNRFLLCNLKHDTYNIFGSCKRIQFSSNISPHLGLSFLPNHQIVNLFSPQSPPSRTRIPRPSLESETSHQPQPLHSLALFACLDHLKGFCLQKVFLFLIADNKKFYPISGLSQNSYS